MQIACWSEIVYTRVESKSDGRLLNQLALSAHNLHVWFEVVECQQGKTECVW